MSTRQQRWSLSAHQAVRAFAKDTKDKQKKLKTYCMKMPALIQRSGAVQALAFVVSRGDEGREFTDALAGTYDAKLKGRQLLTKAQEADQLSHYLALSRDLLEIAAWYRRFAQIELADVDEHDAQELG